MKTREYLDILGKELNVKLDIKPNSNIAGIGNIICDGIITDEICPTEEIYEDFKPDYKVIYSDGSSRPHQPMSVIKTKIMGFIRINKEDPELYADCKIK